MPSPAAPAGPCAYELVGIEAKNLGFKKALIVTSGLRGTDIVEDIEGKVKHAGVDCVVYDKVESNPKDYNSMDSYQLYADEGCDSFISIGGGSSHDACKGAKIVAAHDGRNVNEFDGFNMSENPNIPPHIADNPRKYVAFDDRCIASLAILRPGPLLRLSLGLHRLLRMAEAAVEAAVQLLKDVNIPENFTSVGDYSKNRMGTGIYEGQGKKIKGDANDCQRISEHMMGDACTPGNPMEATVEKLVPMVQDCMTGSL